MALGGSPMKARQFRLGLLTVLGLARKGFFIPYRYADSLARPGERPPYAAIEALFRRAEPAFADVLARVDHYAAALQTVGREPPPAPRWSQDWFPRLDAAAAYTLVRDTKPRRIVELGSGHSTRFLARAVRDGSLPCRITAIDPAPRAALAGLPEVEVLRCTVQEAGSAPFEPLAAGDVLFVDSSHILMPGSDVDIVLNHVLPALPSGVLIHIHDVLLPDDYPARWAWRGYNEQLAVAPLLLAGGYVPLFASHFVATRMRDVLDRSIVARLPIERGAIETSLWLKKAV